MKKIHLIAKLSFVFVILLSVFSVIGFSDYNAEMINTSDKTSIKDDAVDDGEMVTLSFKYAVCTGSEIVKQDEITQILSNTISATDRKSDAAKNKYNALFDCLEMYVNADECPERETTFNKNTTYTYTGINDYVGYYVILKVTQKTYHNSYSFAGKTYDNYYGAYTISVQKYDIVASYDYYDYEIKDKVEVNKNTILALNDLFGIISLASDDNYKLVGLAEEMTDGKPSETTVSLPLQVSASSTYYVLFNKISMNGKYVLGKTISNYTSKGTYTFNIGVAQNEFNLTNDASYYSIDKVVFLGDNSSTITTSSGKIVVGTKIESGVTINFGLNSGDVFLKTTSSSNTQNLEPENSEHSRQYTICLQSDLYVYGTLSIGANCGTTSNIYYEGHICNEYVTLDLNGHNIYVENGTLNLYGLIKNSKDTGEVVAYGGEILTPVVIYDYRGGTATTKLVNQKVMPFQIYSLPYLRCKTRLCYSSDCGWTKFNAVCYATVGILVSAPVPVTIKINFIGGSNDDVLFKIVEQTNSYIEIEGYENDKVTKDRALSSDEVKLCLSRRLKLNFHNCTVKMSNIEMDIASGYKVDTKDYNFPVSSFFDILLVNSDLTFSQSLKMMPGMSFIADKNSNVILSYDSTNSKSAQISVLGDNAYYYDSEKDNLVKNDLIAENQLTYTAAFFKSESLWKYYSGSRFKIYGSLVFQGGNTDIREYLLAGQMDFNRVAYSSDGTTDNLEYIDYSENENPFAKLMEKHSDVKILTYGYDYLLGGSNRDAVIKGYSRPLVSYGKGYYTNGSSADAKVGDYSFRTGIFKVSDTEMYYFNIGETFTLSDNSTCTLEPCTYDETEHIFTDTKTNTKYAYFAASYYPYTNTEGTITLNVTRSNSSTTSVTVVYNSTLERWLRE